MLVLLGQGWVKVNIWWVAALWAVPWDWVRLYRTENN